MTTTPPPLFHDPDRPGHLLELVGVVDSLEGWVIVKPLGDDRPEGAYRMPLEDLTPAR